MNTTTIDDPVAESSDYLVTGTLYGPDGTTPVEPAAVAEILASLSDIENGTTLFADRDVTSSLTTGGVFAMLLEDTDLVSHGTAPMQRRRLTLKIRQSNGRVRYQAIRFSVENMLLPA